MKDIEYWKKEGFAFEARFPPEYDLWVNRTTMQKLRRYVDNREFLSDKTTGEYKLVQEPTDAVSEDAFTYSPGCPMQERERKEINPDTFLPCPFCGRQPEATRLMGYEYWKTEVTCCGFVGKNWDKDIERLWNTRKDR